MHISSSPNTAAMLMRMANASLGHEQQSASNNFMNALHQQTQSPQAAHSVALSSTAGDHVSNKLTKDAKIAENQNKTITTEQSNSKSASHNTATTQSASAASTVNSTAPAGQTTLNTLFNAKGNLSTVQNLKDFALLEGQAMLVKQSILQSQQIAATQQSLLQPAIITQIAILQKLYEKLELLQKQGTLKHQSTAIAAYAQNSSSELNEEAIRAQQSQLLAFTFVERFFKYFDPQKHLALARFFKKGPLGEECHEKNTDDEYGNGYADVDAETDYIKRPRQDKPGMSFHQSFLC